MLLAPLSLEAERGMDGKFLKIGVYDAHKIASLGMRSLLKNIDFSDIELNNLMSDSLNYGEKLGELMQAGAVSGAFKQLPRRTFQSNQVEESFRFVASGKHVQKLLIKIRDENSPSDPLLMAALSLTSPKTKPSVFVLHIGDIG